MRVLLTEGSGLASRQVATRLDELGHEVLAAVSDPLCLARFTRHVRHLVRVPPFGADPLGWFDAVLERAVALEVEVVFPTQEQVTVLSHELPRLRAAGLCTAVPPFGALARLQDKVSARARRWRPRASPNLVPSSCGTGPTSRRGRPSRRSSRHRSAPRRPPCDASRTGASSPAAVRSLRRSEPAVLVQEAAEGALVMAQSVFDGGTMIAFHANERVREGVNGSASVKRSTERPELRAAMDRLGSRLAWHGALSLDAIVTADGPVVIDVNPRLVEPANAVAAGSDLVGVLLGVATGTVPPSGESRPGVTTHQLLMAVLGAAQHTGRRRAVAGEVAAALAHRDAYADRARSSSPSGVIGAPSPSRSWPPWRRCSVPPGTAGSRREPSPATRSAPRAGAR